ncbi:MAG: 2-oxoacid:acceptor oxidoreductase family protein [Bacteroidetes bacterium]|nr:2-oxoacid:acceptor oxidoreductase family protein [Bacteroidota bacterium]MCL5026374.1 2-oxoacid:acceptor oxidoreductase family protein [Chloroflexota bacterium]
MIEIRFHGRGGQRMNLWAEALARAALSEGRYGQTYVSFGLDQVGVPNTAITRVSDRFIRERAAASTTPDFAVLLDASLPGTITAGLKAGGVAVVPSGKAAVGGDKWRVVEVATSGLSADEARDVLLGAVAALSGAAGLGALQSAVRGAGLGDFDGALARGYAAAT